MRNGVVHIVSLRTRALARAALAARSSSDIVLVGRLLKRTRLSTRVQSRHLVARTTGHDVRINTSVHLCKDLSTYFDYRQSIDLRRIDSWNHITFGACEKHIVRKSSPYTSYELAFVPQLSPCIYVPDKRLSFVSDSPEMVHVQHIQASSAVPIARFKAGITSSW